MNNNDQKEERLLRDAKREARDEELRGRELPLLKRSAESRKHVWMVVVGLALFFFVFAPAAGVAALLLHRKFPAIAKDHSFWQLMAGFFIGIAMLLATALVMSMIRRTFGSKCPYCGAAFQLIDRKKEEEHGHYVTLEDARRCGQCHAVILDLDH